MKFESYIPGTYRGKWVDPVVGLRKAQQQAEFLNIIGDQNLIVCGLRTVTYSSVQVDSGRSFTVPYVQFAVTVSAHTERGP